MSAARSFQKYAKYEAEGTRLGNRGEKASASTLFPQMKLVANDVTVVSLKDTGHWVIEERPKETMDALLRFL